MPRCLQVIADDLSGAAECAAALAQAARVPAPLVLQGPLPPAGNWVVDSDTRAMDPQGAAERVARILQDAGRAVSYDGLLFKKIDSTLRGHLADELRAMLDAPGAVRAAVVCPALPTQGRTLKEGVLYVHGQPRFDERGKLLELQGLLAPADPHCVLLRPARTHTAAALARDMVSAIEGGSRVLAVDAADAEDLRRLALAIVIVSRGMRLLAVGAAGLAKALATEVLQAGRPEHPMQAPSSAHLPVLAMVGSFSSVALHQLDELQAASGVHLVRLPAASWLAHDAGMQQALATALGRMEWDEAVVLAIGGDLPSAPAREVVCRMAEAAQALLQRAGTLVLTGGATARAVLDCLGVHRLDVVGELEPGICLSRDGARCVVTKAGAFGDSQSLLRVLRHLGADVSAGTKE